MKSLWMNLVLTLVVVCTLLINRGAFAQQVLPDNLALYSPSAIVLHAQGQVYVSGGEHQNKAVPLMMIRHGEILETGRDSSCSLRLQDGSEIMVPERTQIVL